MTDCNAAVVVNHDLSHTAAYNPLNATGKSQDLFKVYVEPSPTISYELDLKENQSNE